jgi:hypothetical protein
MVNGHPSDLRALRSWKFLTKHAQVLFAVARDPEATVAQLAGAAEITERSAYRILGDLQQAGYVRRRKVGRHNTYEINPALPLGDPTVENETVRDLLRLVGEADVEGHDLSNFMAFDASHEQIRPRLGSAASRRPGGEWGVRMYRDCILSDSAGRGSRRLAYKRKYG